MSFFLLEWHYVHSNFERIASAVCNVHFFPLCWPYFTLKNISKSFMKISMNLEVSGFKQSTEIQTFTLSIHAVNILDFEVHEVQVLLPSSLVNKSILPLHNYNTVAINFIWFQICLPVHRISIGDTIENDWTSFSIKYHCYTLTMSILLFMDICTSEQLSDVNQ
jgi:hypothetical protein